MTVPFPDEEYADRLRRVREAIDEGKLDALLVTTPANICYLTGYETQGLWFFNGLVVPLEGDPFMVTRAAEDTVVQAESTISLSRPFWDSEDPMETLGSALKDFGLGGSRVGYEADSYFFRINELAHLRSVVDCELVAVNALVERRRLRKSTLELEMMRRAARATDAGVAAGVAAVARGVTENDIAAEVYRGLLGAGSHYPALHPFVVSGPRAFMSHATWRGRVVDSEDCVFLEIGGCVHRYHAATMRTVCVGPKSDQVREAEELVLAATDAAMESIRPGVATAEPDRIAREIISQNTFGATQYTRVGYGIGIAFPPGWGEGHMIDMKDGNDSVFEAGMTFHLIPFLQIPDEAAVGISETIVVTSNGCERLTGSRRVVFEAG